MKRPCLFIGGPWDGQRQAIPDKHQSLIIRRDMPMLDDDIIDGYQYARMNLAGDYSIFVGEDIKHVIPVLIEGYRKP